ncbi:hypothetical protein FOZ63_018245, partial [Perkinsus olseni]
GRSAKRRRSDVSSIIASDKESRFNGAEELFATSHPMFERFSVEKPQRRSLITDFYDHKPLASQVAKFHKHFITWAMVELSDADLSGLASALMSPFLVDAEDTLRPGYRGMHLRSTKSAEEIMHSMMESPSTKRPELRRLQLFCARPSVLRGLATLVSLFAWIPRSALFLYKLKNR